MYCPKCKKIIEDDSVFCEYCGVKIKKSKWPLFGAIVGVIAAIVVVGIFTIDLSGGKSKKTKDSYSFEIGEASFTMRKVEGGTFIMGALDSDPEAKAWEKPAHSVTLDSYYIGETEVTQKLWKQVMGYNPSWFVGDDYPVDKVTWNESVDFCQKLSQMTGFHFRLPTEAEWEFAARDGRGSSPTPYAGSANINQVAWYGENSGITTHDVSTKDPNGLGLYDMCGNVAEWCWDYYSPVLASGAQTNPHGPSSGDMHVKRGGSWLDDPQQCTVFYRSGSTPNGKSSNLGFRVCCSAGTEM